MSMKTTLIAAALALTGSTAILPAQAGNWSLSAPQIDVPYSDLNLTNPMGAELMLRRIQMAASKVCGGHPDNRLAGEVYRYRQCVRTATHAAVAQLNAPLVIAFYTGRRPVDPRYAQGGVATRR